MKKLILTLCALSISITFSLLPENAGAAKKRELTVNQIMRKSSPAKAMSIHRKLLKNKPSPTKVKQLKRRYMSLRSKLRRPISRVPATADQQYANLIAPLNWCTNLVRSTCGSEKQCPNSTGCPIALQMLDLYNDETNPQEKMDIEYSCIAALEDGYVFPSCE